MANNESAGVWPTDWDSAGPPQGITPLAALAARRLRNLSIRIATGQGPAAAPDLGSYKIKSAAVRVIWPIKTIDISVPKFELN